jgi:hypothetical protein
MKNHESKLIIKHKICKIEFFSSKRMQITCCRSFAIVLQSLVKQRHGRMDDHA